LRVAFFAVAFLRPPFLRPPFFFRAAIPGFPPYLVAPCPRGPCLGLSGPRGDGLEGNRACSSVFLHAHRGTRATVAANRNTEISDSSRHNTKKNNRMDELVAATRTRTPRRRARARADGAPRGRNGARNCSIAKEKPRAEGAVGR
jgi:hypothetical protein